LHRKIKEKDEISMLFTPHPFAFILQKWWGVLGLNQ
jgi:hypothetical protein